MSFGLHQLHSHHMSYEMPQVVKGRVGLNPPAVLPGMVSSAGSHYMKPTIAGLVMNKKAAPPQVPVTHCKNAPATKLPLGMVRLEQH